MPILYLLVVSAFGLNHCITPKFSKVKYFTAFEVLYNRIKNLPLYGTTLENMKKEIKNIANKIIYKYRRERIQKLFTDKDLETLKTLGENNELHITKPDKGNGIVILNKKDYTEKIESILSDSSIFQNCYHDITFSGNSSF